MDVVLAAGGAPWEAAAIGEIEGSSKLRLARRCVDVADLLAVTHTGVASAALVHTELSGLDADAVHRLERAGVRVAAVEADEARCLGLGISRRLSIGALEVLTRDTVAADTSPDRGTIVAVWGPAGAPGRSTVALSLAAAAAAQGVDTVLVDADTYGGALAQLLAVLDDVSGLMAACRAANNGHPGQVDDHLLEIEPQLRLLTGLPRADMWPQIRPGALELVLRQLRSTAELVVIDCGFALEPGAGTGSTRNQATLQTLELADQVVAVGKADPVGLARLVRGVHDLAEARRGAQPPTVVINMMRSTLGWKEREVDSTLRRLTGLATTSFLPFDQLSLDAAMMSGRTPRLAAPSSPFVARVEVLAKQLATESRGRSTVSAS
ncbi:P-loop NTPase [Aeromicrobium panaciterrae]|uniref:AAA family ATPase n=1 Tax=Aeromicrobium panaciterrae TaxID=363861 RepID=UPI0031DEDBE0